MINLNLNQPKAAPHSQKGAARYKLKFSEEKIKELLTASYTAIVNGRGVNLKPDKSTFDKIASVSKWICSDNYKPCLLLYGGIGNGKTSMARSVQYLFEKLKNKFKNIDNYHLKSNSEKQFIDDICYNMPIPLFVSAIDIAIAAKNDKERYENIKNSRFLIIDDMGIEPSVINDYGTELSPISNIIFSRYDRQSPTIITSNLDDDLIESKYGERIYDRIKEIFEKINYENGSYR